MKYQALLEFESNNFVSALKTMRDIQIMDRFKDNDIRVAYCYEKTAENSENVVQFPIEIRKKN